MTNINRPSTLKTYENIENVDKFVGNDWGLKKQKYGKYW